jgi:CheY-like chemotaxis protein
MMSELFKLYGHIVRTASDGRQALEAAVIFLPDAAVLDIGLPRLNGFEVAAALHRFKASMKLIAVTGRPRTQASAEDGFVFDHYLMKPVSADALINAVASAALPHAARDGMKPKL